MTIESFMKRNPVLGFFALTFAISWTGAIVLGALNGIPATSEEFEELWTLVVLPYFLGPILSGIIMTRIVHGRSGLRELGSRMTRWRVGIRWYAVALLALPLLVTPLLLVSSLFSSDFVPGIVDGTDKLGILLSGIITGLLFAGLMEETGWTGFAVPTLRRRYDVVSTGLFVGILWGIWHFPTKILISEALGLTPFLAVDLMTAVVNLTAWRILLVWVNDRTGSLFVTMMMHASLTACSLFILAPPATGEPLVIFNIVAAAAAWALVGVLAIINRWHLPAISRRMNGNKIRGGM